MKGSTSQPLSIHAFQEAATAWSTYSVEESAGHLPCGIVQPNRFEIMVDYHNAKRISVKFAVPYAAY